MQAIVVKAAGGPEMLELASVPDPKLSPHDALIEVHACGVNRADLLQRRGYYAPPPGESDILGLECAGVVREVGRDVAGVAVGERVMALLGGGGYAELARVNEHLVLPIPEHCDFERAAAIPEAFLTAYEALLRTAELAPGERALIHAGASGIGTAALQIAREVGAQVFTTARSAKIEKLREFGVHRVIDSTSEDFADVVERETHGYGVDVIIDLIGAAYAQQNQRVLSAGGRWVVVGLLGGARASIDLERLLRKRQRLIGVVMRTRPLLDKTAIVRGFARDLLPWFAQGRLTPVVDSVFPLADAKAAHARMEANQNFGKLILSVRR